ncbi:type II secretion system protein [Companilactobacillus ginsenosidimutans]|uniref:Competence protein ComGD n=1 Tax=Companilactobacillus ginsenosidimutans TaxID=1007676 RepID=A0A0H4R3C0_9LACO|nr:type II secretion system protein [Companilactobacillus ginsenosidimutans]AKP68270.1 hypothetical protein ABM34_12475 [Companilactobacillus ginsenosidimutans]
MEQNTKRRGFTLVEAALTLLIFCSLVLIGTLQVKNYQESTEEKLALKSFEDDWKNALNEGYLRNYNVIVDVLDDRVIFIRDGNRHDVLLPKTLSPTKQLAINVSRSGETRPKTIEFKSTKSHKIYTYTIQLNWGLLLEKAT